VRPAQLRVQRGDDRVGAVELEHPVEVAAPEAEIARQADDGLLAVARARALAQFLPHDPLADLPVGLHPQVVDRLVGTRPRRREDLTDIAQQLVVAHGQGERGHPDRSSLNQGNSRAPIRHDIASCYPGYPTTHGR
jgi:hypothetical protein